MAKGKRSGHRIQATRNEVAQARYAVRHGLISNRAKITKAGMSRNVKRKLDDLRTLGAVPEYSTRKGASRPHIVEQPQRVPVRVYKPEIFKGQGYSVFGNFIVTSKPKEVKANIRQGGLGGTTLFEEKGPAPLRYGVMERISLSRNGIRNFSDLRDALRDNKADNILKHPDDMYSFLYFDNLPNPNRTVNHKRVHGPRGTGAEFYDGEDLKAYLEKYEPIMGDSEDAFKHFDLIRVHYSRTLRNERAKPQQRRSHHSDREKKMRALQRKAKEVRDLKAQSITPAERKAQQRAKETPEQRAMRQARDKEARRRARAEGRSK